MALAAGARFGDYEILDRLGAGGMGEVWRARDTRLERELALKVLPADALTDQGARARLLREARTAARLNHPNVCIIHEVGEAEGQVFFAMEVVEGKPLSSILEAGALPVERVLSYGAQVAEALAHAHGRGVVHRDLKSANVVITAEGRAKVLDFGLAKRLAGQELADATTRSQDALTAPGAVVGTLAYMAPEQLRGEAADARSDIWALGVVLHEMLGGQRPFVAQTGFALSAAILNEAPAPLPASVPSALQAVVERCLAKAPGERYQTAGEVRAALQTLQSGDVMTGLPQQPAVPRGRRWPRASAVVVGVAAALAFFVALDVGGVRQMLLGRLRGGERVVRMAVLPFANLSGEQEQEYLADGLTQEMITQLGRLHPGSLSVIARSSVMRYKNGDTPVDQIGRELDVDYVLEGGTQREGNRIRISAELIHVEDQTQLWAESYERELSGILRLQSEVARRVAEALTLELLPAEQARLASTRSVNPDAYGAYLKGTYHWQKMTPADLDTAQRYFELALEKDPDYAPAYEGLAWVWGTRQQHGLVPPQDATPKVRAATHRAVELDDGSAGAHFSLAALKTWTDWDWAGALPEWRRALEINPNSAEVHAFYGHFLVTVGRPQEALWHSERAIELDPYNAMLHGLHAVVLWSNWRYADCAAAARTALRLQPTEPMALAALKVTAPSTGQYDDAVAATRTWLETVYGDPVLTEALEAGWQEGGFAEAMRRLAEAESVRFRTAYVAPTEIGDCYLCAGDHVRALEWYEKAYEIRDPCLPYIVTALYFDALRSEPRYQELLRTMNLPQRPDQPLDLEEP